VKSADGRCVDAATVAASNAVAEAKAMATRHTVTAVAVEAVDFSRSVSPQMARDRVATKAVLDAIVAVFPAAVVIRPGGNGDVEIPDVLRGRRPPHFTRSSDYPKRRHEQSAWRVAVAAGERSTP
jgi:hypothetical protein